MEMPRVGSLTLDEDAGWYYSGPVSAGALAGTVGQIVVDDDYPEDEDQESVNRAANAFLSGDDGALRSASAHVFAYYLDTVREIREQGWDVEMPDIAEPFAVWEHVSFGHEFHVTRGGVSDGPVYVSIECECAWEPEHGLHLVFRDGRTITKVGPYDGHMTNALAYGRPDLEGDVYVSPFAL